MSAAIGFFPLGLIYEFEIAGKRAIGVQAIEVLLYLPPLVQILYLKSRLLYGRVLLSCEANEKLHKLFHFVKMVENREMPHLYYDFAHIL